MDSLERCDQITALLFPGMDLSLAEVLIAGLAAILGWLIAHRTYEASLDQYRLSASTAAADWIRDLRSWASEAIDVLAEAAYHSARGETGPAADASTVL